MATATKAPPRRTQRERSEATTNELVRTARRLFARDGYAATSLDAVVAACGVTKGALYHHFSGKRELFDAVFEAEQRHLYARLIDAYRKPRDPVRGAYAGCRAFLEACLDPGVQRITLLDAPSVLGWERMRELEAEYGLALIKQGIRNGMEADRIPRREIDPLAHLLFGALCEGAMFIARAEDQQAALRRIDREVRGILDSLTA
jgi:AcrR family transcriptional regulator